MTFHEILEHLDTAYGVLNPYPQLLVMARQEFAAGAHLLTASAYAGGHAISFLWTPGSR